MIHPVPVQASGTESLFKDFAMKRIPTSAVVLLTLLAAAHLADDWLRRKAARNETPKSKPLERWENEGGALAPASGGVKATSQVPN
jgi:hypothetical protein